MNINQFYKNDFEWIESPFETIQVIKQKIKSYIEEHILIYDDNKEIDLIQIELLINARYGQIVDIEFIEKYLTDLSKGHDAPIRKITPYDITRYFRNNRIQRLYGKRKN